MLVRSSSGARTTGSTSSALLQTLTCSLSNPKTCRQHGPDGRPDVAQGNRDDVLLWLLRRRRRMCGSLALAFPLTTAQFSSSTRGVSSWSRLGATTVIATTPTPKLASLQSSLPFTTSTNRRHPPTSPRLWDANETSDHRQYQELGIGQHSSQQQRHLSNPGTNNSGTVAAVATPYYPITPPRPISIAVQRDEIIMQQAPIGTLTAAQIDLLRSGIEALCPIKTTLHGNKPDKTSREKLYTAERYLYRWIQEVNFVATQQQQQQQQQVQFQQSTLNSATSSCVDNTSATSIQRHKLMIPVKVWKAILRASANLPLPMTTSTASTPPIQGGTAFPAPSTSTATNATAATAATMTTQYPFQIAHGHLQHMIQLHQMFPSYHPAPMEVHYSTVLYACSNCSAVSTAAVTMAEALIRTLEETSSTAQSTTLNTVSPTVEMYNNVISAHANRAATVYGAAAAAEDWLMHMSSMASSTSSTSAVNDHSVQNGPLPPSPSVSTQPDTRTFNRVLKAWCNSPEEQGGNRAADILHLMMELVDSGIENSHRVGPDVVSFGTVITAFAKRRQPEQCQAILEQAVQYFYARPAAPSPPAIRTAARYYGSSGAQDLTQCWNATLFAWAQSGAPDAPERVESLVADGIRVSATHCERMARLDTATYAACIDAHLQSGRPHRIERAEQHLRTMVEHYRQQLQQLRRVGNSRDDRPVPSIRNMTARPTTKEFDTVIHAWYRSLDEYEGRNDSDAIPRKPFGYTATRATNLLRSMIELSDSFRFSECAPATGTFNMCIDSWCNTSNACITMSKKENERTSGLNEIDNDISDRILAYQKELKDQAMAAATKAVGVLDIAENRQLTSDFSYSTVIDALCRIEDANCSLVAAKILQRWERETARRDLPWPSTAQQTYSTLLASLGKVVGTLEAAEIALQILRGIPRAGPRSLVDKGSLYSAVMRAFAPFPMEAGEVAKDLFQELLAEDKNRESNLSLSTPFCERVLWALASTKDKASAGFACEVLTSMLDSHISGRPNMEPSTHCFNACIQALTEHSDVEYTSYAVNLLRAIVDQFEQKKLSQLPSPAAFYKVIKSCKDIGSAEMNQLADDLIHVVERLLKTARR